MATTSAIYNVNEDFFRSGAGTTKPNGTTDTTEAVARPGNLGLGIADPSTLAGKLDISGAQILRPVALPNFATNGSVGTAATTVDVASHLTLTQTTAGIALTLPAPTNAQAGRLLIVESLPASTVPVTIAGQAVLPGAGTFFVWSGTAWVALGSAAVAPSNRAYVLCDAPAKKAVANATATLANWTEITDAGNNHAAGIFTAPRTGLYQVSAMVTYLAAAWNANTYAQIAIAINGVDARQATSSNESAGNRIVSVNISATISLTAGQNIRINVYQNSGTAKNTTGGINSFYTIVEL